MKRFLILLATLPALSGCSAPSTASDGNGVGPAPTATVAVATPTGLPESTAPHPAPPLQALVRDDLKDRDLLGPGCAFHAAPGGPVLLVLRDAGDGLAKFGRHLRSLTAATPGREAIAAGGIGAGDGMSFSIRHAPGGTGKDGPATLEVRTPDDGFSRYADGRWDCGDAPL